MSPRKRRKPDRYHHGNLRPVLLEVAGEILESEGVDGLRLIKVAELADVSASAPYNHFKSRKSLLIALAAEVILPH